MPNVLNYTEHIAAKWLKFKISNASSQKLDKKKSTMNDVSVGLVFFQVMYDSSAFRLDLQWCINKIYKALSKQSAPVLKYTLYLFLVTKGTQTMGIILYIKSVKKINIKNWHIIKIRKDSGNSFSRLFHSEYNASVQYNASI